MDLNFRQLLTCDKQFIDSILRSSDKRFCEYTFGNMFCWGSRHDMLIACTENGFVTGTPEKSRFNFPAGTDSLEIVKCLLQNFENLTLTCLSESEANLLKAEYDCFEITEQKDRFDYIYQTEKLQTLSGKKLAAKRNHINAFLAQSSFETKPITEGSIPLLFEFNKKWCMGLCDSGGSLHAEMCAVQTGLENFSALGFYGLILYRGDEICGYSYGEPINSDTFCVHVEKADAEVRGAYQLINREFAKAFGDGFEYFNREDDAGDEGLRKAKLSYYPTDIGRKFKAERIK